MTINEAIDRTDELKHNTYKISEKIKWLSTVDSMVKRLIIDTHEKANDVVFDGYTEETSGDTVLLVPEPFDQMYLRWMEAQIDYHNAEYSRYNNSISLFNTEFQAYQSYYHRMHKPKGAGSWAF